LKIKKSLSCWELGDSSNHSVVNSAGPHLDLEESIQSPVVVPRVSNEPIVNFILHSPSNNLNGVSSNWSGIGAWSINSALVVHEVIINSEGSLNWSISHDLLLNVGDSSDRVSTESIVQVILVGFGSVRRLAGPHTSRSRVLRESATLRVGSVRSVYMVDAWWECVWLAPTSVLVQRSSDQSTVDPISPGSRGIASIASISAEETTASQQIFRGDSGLDGSIRGNADSVRDGLSSSEGPARTTVGLVSDVRQALA